MGTVWRAEDSLLDRQVALKQLRVSPYLDEEELATLYERTRREARSAARITHPNVVVVHDVVEDRGLPCIVMEYVPSTTLADVLKLGTIEPEEAARVGRGMIAALRAAHAAGVLHRDVKPGNVLLGDDGRVVLTDFGIARSTGTSTLTKTGEMVGSIDYIAPERVKGARPGPASDLWALGATLYQALEGRPPFRKDTAVETAYATVMDPLEPPRGAGPLTKLIETLLAKDPALRPPAELVEQILREPAAEPDTAHIRAAELTDMPAAPVHDPYGETAVARAEERREDTAETIRRAGTARGTVPVAAPVGTVAAAAATAATTAPEAAAGPVEGGRKRRGPLLWSAVAVVVAAGIAGGLFVVLQDGGKGTGTKTVASDTSEKDATADKPRASASPDLAASVAPSLPPLPPGYRLAEEQAMGFSVPVPNGWTRQAKSSEEVNYIDATGRVGLKVNVLPFASGDHLQHFKDVEAQVKKQESTYEMERMQETKYRGESAALWQYKWKGRAREYRAVDLGFGKEGGKEYAIYLSAPSADWDRYRPVFDAACDGFRVKP
ncbi:serine/threonine protein phosphatase [Streptomyces griseocarneus]|nr:serine/threonine protein phosphatase [Streptomyces griseocarneus]